MTYIIKTDYHFADDVSSERLGPRTDSSEKRFLKGVGRTIYDCFSESLYSLKRALDPLKLLIMLLLMTTVTVFSDRGRFSKINYFNPQNKPEGRKDVIRKHTA